MILEPLLLFGIAFPKIGLKSPGITLLISNLTVVFVSYKILSSGINGVKIKIPK
jgi:hypothetical protein